MAREIRLDRPQLTFPLLRSFRLPNFCGCCSAAPTTTVKLEHRLQLSARQTSVTSVRIPACAYCARHYNLTHASDLLAVLLVALSLFVAALLALVKVYLIPIWFILLICLVIAWDKRNRREAERLASRPECASATFVELRRAPNREYTIRFSSDEFARAYAELNSRLR